MAKSDIPFGSEFSPERGIALGDLLGLLELHEGDRPSFVQAVYERFWSKKADGSPRSAGMGKGKEATGDGLSFATNTLYALASYRLVEISKEDRNVLRITDDARRLIAFRPKPEDLHRAFARHILVNCRGLDVIQTVRDMQIGGHPVTVPEIAAHLKERGIYVPPGGTHLNSMRQWLALAGVIQEGWVVDQVALDAVLGVDEATLAVFAGLDDAQIAFARALARLNAEEYPSNKVAEYAANIFGVKFPVKSLPNAILKPLEQAGLVTSRKTTAGRGAKPHIVRPTPLLRKEVTAPLLEGLTRSVGRKYRKLIRLPLADILHDLDLPAKETHKRGIALEALALYLTRIIGLEFVGWRVHARETSYAEVDAVVEGARLIFSRWQIQCKNTATVNEGDVAKEVGLALRLKSNVVMVVTTGRFSPQAKLYARDVMEDTNYHMILLSGADLRQLRKDPAAIMALLGRQARDAMAIKRASLPKEF